MTSFSSSHRYSFPYSTKNGRHSSGCIAGFIRRILCISSDHPSCSFDRLEAEEKDPLMGSASVTPGLVARLMGLESLPLIDSSKRSSSTNSVDWFRKSRSSPNVRRRKIISPYQELELEDDKFFILSFDHDDESMEFSTRSKSKSSAKKKQVMGAKCKKKSRRRDKVHECNKENQGVSKVLAENCVAPQKGLDYDRKIIDEKNTSKVLRPVKNSCQNSSSGENIMKEKVMQESSAVVKLEEEGGSENSSPNSVLEFPPDPGTASSGDVSRLGSSRSRRTLSEELENFSKSTRDGSSEEEKHKRMKKRNPNYAEKWDEIGKLAAREVMKWSWLGNENSKNNDQLKEIGRDIASEMLDQLLCELLINF